MARAVVTGGAQGIGRAVAQRLAASGARVAIWDAESAYTFVEVRGRVVETITGPDALDSINALSRKYTGGDYAPDIQSERVILRIAPERQVTR